MTHFAIPALSLAYFFFLGFWLYLCHICRKSLHRIHSLMSRILLVRALNSLLDPAGGPQSRDDPLIRSVRLALTFVLVLFLMEVARLFLRPLTQNRAKKAMTAVIAAQLAANAALGEVEGITGHPTSRELMGFLIVNVLGGFLVLACLVWHVVQLKEASKSEKKKAAGVGRRAVDGVIIFTQLYIGVLCLSYFTKSWSSVLRAIVESYDQKTGVATGAAVEEIVSLVGYLVLFYWLRPDAVKSSDYFVTQEEEEEGAVVSGGSFP